MSHQHNISCLEAGPSNSLVCKITGETTETKPAPPPSTSDAYDAFLGEPGSKLKGSLRRDRITGRLWLMFAGKPSESIRAELNAAGWRWSGYRKEWNNPSRYARVPPSIEATDEGLVDYSTERAGRLEARSAGHAVKSQTARKRFETISSGIPMGQPVLVGHHSEAHHRRDIARMDSAIRKSFEHGQEAQRLATAATSSQRHQAYVQSTPVIQRRLDRLRADLRSMERTYTRAGEWKPEDASEYRRKMDIKRSEIVENEQALAEAGGARTFDIEPGNVVRAQGRLYRVERVGPKNFVGVVIEGGAAGMKLQIGRENIQEITEKGTPPQPKPKAPKSGNPERDQMIRFIYGKKSPDYRGRTPSGQHSVMDYDKGTYSVVLETLPDNDLKALAIKNGWTGPPIRKTNYTPEDRLTVLKELSAQGYHSKKTVEGTKLTGLLARTALQVHEQLSPENQIKLLSLPMPKLAAAVMKMVS